VLGYAPDVSSPSPRPAFVVFGLAAVVFVGGALAAALTGSPPPPSRNEPATFAGLRGEALGQLASRWLGPVPPDVARAVFVPAGSSLEHPPVVLGVGTYDESFSLAAPATPAKVVGFYRALLGGSGWHVLEAGTVVHGAAGPRVPSGASSSPPSGSQASRVAGTESPRGSPVPKARRANGVTGPSGSVPSTYQLLARRGASDGENWELGVDVDLAAPSDARAPMTLIDLRLYEAVLPD
jgi:hypothetical protein